MVQLPSLLQNTYITCEQASILRSWQPIPLLFSLYWTCQRTQCLRGFSSVNTPSILSVSEQNLNYPPKTFYLKNGGEESRTLVHTICVNTVLHVSLVLAFQPLPGWRKLNKYPPRSALSLCLTSYAIAQPLDEFTYIPHKQCKLPRTVSNLCNLQFQLQVTSQAANATLLPKLAEITLLAFISFCTILRGHTSLRAVFTPVLACQYQAPPYIKFLNVQFFFIIS